MMNTRLSRFCLSVILFACSAQTAVAGFVELARSGQWKELLRVAQLRADQLPLSSSEAIVAATAAQSQDNVHAQEIFLIQAAVDDELAQVAHVELALLIAKNEADRAVLLVLPTLHHAQTPQLRRAALDVLGISLASGLEDATRANVLRVKRRGSLSQRRRLELIQAKVDPKNQRARLSSLIERGSGDLEALEAARILMHEDMSGREMWLVGKALYRHALYSEAEPLFEAVDGANIASAPSWEVAFLRGRCAFRGERFGEAIAWYQKAGRRTTNAERKAGFLVHIGRSQELGGALEPAIESARAAVLTKTTDDRRLLLARLRLRNEQPEFAAQGIAQIRGRSARSRGYLMIALDLMGQEDSSEIEKWLKRVSRNPWRGPASLLAARIEIDKQNWKKARHELERHVENLDPFWAGYARDLIRLLPAEEIELWRSGIEEKIKTETGNARKRRLATWAKLEIDSRHMERIRTCVTAEIDFASTEADPIFKKNLAGRLWDLGLEAGAIQWNPGNMPKASPAETLWSAQRFLEFNAPDRAIRSTYNAWRGGAGWISVRALPVDVRRSYHPLPYRDLVMAAAATHKVPWNFLAGVAREESKWNSNVLSQVGARGLLQLMPGTARATAIRIGREEPHEDELFDPDLSLELGAAELGRLFKRYEGRSELVAAAYNAGEKQVDLWFEQCGKECTPEMFIMNISFKATRGYTADVLASAQTYSELYDVEAKADNKRTTLEK